MAKIKEVIASSYAGGHNIITAGTELKGDINSVEDFRIDGSVTGLINCKGKVIIGHNGSVTGDITCGNVELYGTLSGNIECTETVVLRSSCMLTGDIKTKTIEIESEAKFSGGCSMLEK